MGDASMNVGMPPRSRNQRVPTACDTPTDVAASSLVLPVAICTPERPLDLPPK